MGDEIVTLESQDGIILQLNIKDAKMCKTVENLIEDAGTQAPIPLPNVSGRILRKVVEYCKQHSSDIVTPEADQKEEMGEWDLEFTRNLDQPTLFQLILAANYLDAKGLLDVCCKTVANMVKGKTPEEIRATFGITEPFTPEEEEQVKRENEWCQ